MAAQVVKKKTWKEMRDEVFDRSQRFFLAGGILLFVAGFLIVTGLVGISAVEVDDELFRWFSLGLIVLGVVCYIVLVPTCFIIFFKLDKKWREI